MTREAKRLLEQALASPEFMTEVKAAVLASPLVKAKDEEIARLRAEVERLQSYADGQAEVLKAVAARAEAAEKDRDLNYSRLGVWQQRAESAEARERVLREALTAAMRIVNNVSDCAYHEDYRKVREMVAALPPPGAKEGDR